MGGLPETVATVRELALRLELSSVKQALREQVEEMRVSLATALEQTSSGVSPAITAASWSAWATRYTWAAIFLSEPSGAYLPPDGRFRPPYAKHICFCSYSQTGEDNN